MYIYGTQFVEALLSVLYGGDGLVRFLLDLARHRIEVCRANGEVVNLRYIADKSGSCIVFEERGANFVRKTDFTLRSSCRTADKTFPVRLSASSPATNRPANMPLSNCNLLVMFFSSRINVNPVL